MSLTLPHDPLMLLLEDPALLAALLAGEDPALAPAVSGPVVDAPPAAAPPVPVPAPAEAPPFALVPEEVFPTREELDALLADSYLPEPGIDRATRAELAEAFGLDPALVDDEVAFIAALAALEPPPEDDLPEFVSGEPAWDLAWVESVREDWALG